MKTTTEKDALRQCSCFGERVEAEAKPKRLVFGALMSRQSSIMQRDYEGERAGHKSASEVTLSIEPKGGRAVDGQCAVNQKETSNVLKASRCVREVELEAIECVNLRESSRGLAAVGAPAVLGELDEGERVLTVDNSRVITLLNGQVRWRGTIIQGDDGAAHYEALRPAMVIAIVSEEVKAVSVGDFLALVGAKETVYLHRREGGYNGVNPSKCVPQIFFNATERLTHSATIEEFTLPQPQSDWRTFADANKNGYQQAVKKAMTAMRDEAQQDGRFVDAVSVRWGIRLYDDSYLCFGPAKVVGVDAVRVSSHTADTIVSGGQYTGLAACTLNRGSYRLGMTIFNGHDASWDSLVKSVDILVSDGEAMNRDGNIDCLCASGSPRKLWFQPKPVDWLSAGMKLAQAGEWRVVASIAGGEALRERRAEAANVVRSTQPLAQNYETYALKSVGGVASVGAAEVAKSIERMSLSEGGGCAAEIAGRVAMGDVYRRRGMNWHIWEQIGAVQSSDSCVAVEEVTLSTSEGVKTILEMSTLPFTPQSLSPIVCHPDSRVQQMKLLLYTSSGAVRWESRASPLHKHGVSVVIGEGLNVQTFVPVENPDPLPAANIRLEETFPRKVEISNVGNPFVTAHTCSAGGRVSGLAEMSKPLYNGGFGRYTAYVFSESGLYALQEGSGGYGNLRKINDVLLGSKAVCSGGNSVWFVSRDGYLCRADGKDVRRVMPTSAADVQMAWMPRKSELAVLSGGRQAPVVVMESGRYFDRTVRLSSLWSGNGMALAVGVDGNLLDMNREVSALVAVEWLSQPIKLSALVERLPLRVAWNAFGEGVDMELSVLGENGRSCHGFLLNCLHVSGNVNYPIESPIAAADVRVVRLHLTGTCGGDLAFEGVVV